MLAARVEASAQRGSEHLIKIDDGSRRGSPTLSRGPLETPRKQALQAAAAAANDERRGLAARVGAGGDAEAGREGEGRVHAVLPGRPGLAAALQRALYETDGRAQSLPGRQR